MTSIHALKTQFHQWTNPYLPYHWLESWLLFVLDKDKVFLMLHDDYVLSDDEYDAFHKGLARLQQGIPLAYLIGWQGFFGREFKVNEHTLIPRADTEVLVEAVLTFVRNRSLQSPYLLDLGAGSGCIGITLAKELPNSQVLLGDVSAYALAVATDNARQLGAANCQFCQTSWYEGIEGRFDVIVSNPPYIAKNDEHLEHLKAEPITALVAEDEGLSDIKCIIDGSLHHLVRGGMLAIEHGHDQGSVVQALFNKANFKEVDTIKDYGGNDRITIGIYDEVYHE